MLRTVTLVSAALVALAAPALAHPGHEAPLFHTHADDIGLAAAAMLLIVVAAGLGRAVKRLLAR
jgi:hypothetical protein